MQREGSLYLRPKSAKSSSSTWTALSAVGESNGDLHNIVQRNTASVALPILVSIIPEVKPLTKSLAPG